MSDNKTSEAAKQFLEYKCNCVMSGCSCSRMVTPKMIAVAEKFQKIEEAICNLENDDNSIPDHAWKLIQEAIAFDPISECTN